MCGGYIQPSNQSIVILALMGAYPGRTPSALLLFFEEPIRSLTHFCEPAANRMPPFIGSSVDIRGENDIPEQGSGRQELDGNE